MSNTVIKETAAARAAHLNWRFAAVSAAAVTSLLLVGCGSEDPSPATAPPDDRASTSATTDAPASAATSAATSAAASEAPAASPLEGSWQAGPISVEETHATVRRYGLGKWLKGLRENPPFFGDTVLTLTIENGAWDLYGISEGGPPAPIDYDAEYEIDGDTVVFHHSDGSNFYRWQVDGDDILTLEFVRSTLPGFKGIPDEVFQRALYMTSAFTRQG